MITDKLTQRFLDNPSYLDNGAGALAKRFDCSKSDIIDAKMNVRAILDRRKKEGEFKEVEKDSTNSPKHVSTETSGEGEVHKFESTKSLSPEEIRNLVQVDNITTEVARTWNKLQPNGVWTYSVDIRYKVPNFYSKSELKERLKEIFPDVSPVSFPAVDVFDEQALVILISDDHAGALNGESLYGNKWNPALYEERLTMIATLVNSYAAPFEEIHIISLGDQLNGWNQETTRGGHKVRSTSNKDQFDIYTNARRKFYDSIFTSKMAAKYFVHDIENSNHSGKDFSYMANKLLEVYLEAKFPFVIRKSYFKAVQSFDYGVHTIGFGHGKDEEFMTRPMPFKLDPKTDLFLYEYFLTNKKSPTDRRVTFYKGDLHSYGVEKGKFGKYVNVPSMMGANDYSEPNFGNNEAGAILDIYDKKSKLVSHLPVWF